MKKLLYFALILALLTLGLCMVTFAAGTFTQTSTGAPGSQPVQQCEVITWNFTADSLGNFPTLGTTGLASGIVRGWIYAVDIYAVGTTAPTSGSNITFITSDTGNDVLAGKGLGYIKASAPQLNPAWWVNLGTLSPVITGNSVSGAQVNVRASIWKQLN